MMIELLPLGCSSIYACPFGLSVICANDKSKLFEVNVSWSCLPSASFPKRQANFALGEDDACKRATATAVFAPWKKYNEKEKKLKDK